MSMIDKLEFFMALAKAEHFGRAAQRARPHRADAFRLSQSGANRLSGVAETIEITYRPANMIY
jgi:hypothetical protein